MAEFQYHSALQDFRRARHRADLERLVAFLKEKSASLLSSDDVDKILQARRSARQELKKIPLDTIVGSVSNYHDLSRSFFPKNRRSQQQGAIVEMLVNGVKGKLPPVEVYQIGKNYFVYDGGHRVSVARQMGATVIEAYVTTMNLSTPFSPGIHPDAMILDIETAEFLEHTQLARLCSPENLTITAPGKYRILEDQIDICLYDMKEEQQREVPYEEAVIHWYDTIYLPVLKMIEGLEILRDFPERTASDMFIWIFEHRALTRQFGTIYDSAYVTEVWYRIPGAGTSEKHADELMTQTENQNFLEHTRLHKLRPGADLHVTIAGKYHLLKEHIRVHRYFMGLEQKREIPYHEAVTHWYDTVYLPIVQFISDQDILEDFPSHTITDLYLWISEYLVISRQSDPSQTETYLTEIWTKMRYFPYVDLDEFMITVEHIDFLFHTHLNDLYPRTDLRVSTPGKYRILEKHIEVHRYFMGIELQREIPYAEAVEHWYNEVYLQILNVIGEHRISREFPDLTVTDLYLWLSEHRSTLEKQLRHVVEIDTAANDLANRFGSHKSSPLSGSSKNVLDIVSLKKSDPVRSQRVKIAAQRRSHLFAEILVPMNGHKDGWFVVEQALEIAQWEDAHVSGLHVVSSRHQLDSTTIFRLKDQFEQRCKAVEVDGELLVEVGNIVEKICEHIRQTDLTILHLLHAPDSPTSSQLQSELRTLHQEGRPSLLLALPKSFTPLSKALLVYDGSPKANQALFFSVYLAEQWELSLVVMTVDTEANTRAFVKNYLKRYGIEAAFVQQRGKLSESIGKMIREHSCDFIILGSSDKHPIFEVMFDHSVDPEFNTIQCPILIC